jgi:hypothetical protein
MAMDLLWSDGLPRSELSALEILVLRTFGNDEMHIEKRRFNPTYLRHIALTVS